MYIMTDEEFEGAVQEALDSIPERFTADLENVAILVDDEPDEEEMGEDADVYETEDGDVLGYYDGVSLLERADGYGDYGDYPDTIVIFKGPHERLGGNRAETLEEVKRTVIHEIGHYFGMDEDQIEQMGYA